MKFEEAREKIEQTLEEYKNRINFDEIAVSTVISYQNEDGDECASDDKRLRFLSGEIFISHANLSDDEKLGYCMVIDCKRKNNIPEKQVAEEIEGFSTELDRFIEELGQAEGKDLFISALAQIAAEESAALEEQFKEQMAKLDRNIKTMNITTICVAVVAVLALIIVQLCK